MKLLLLFIFFYNLCFSYSNQYTYLVDNYDKEIEIEAKIISNIAKSSIKDEIKLYIPNISNLERNAYSKFINLVDNCEDANFIFLKKDMKINSLCKNDNSNKLIFTDNYEKLLNDNRYLGAFFWNKSRPNITFVKNRLENKKIKLSLDYEKFIEDF
ncbi:hypothetical protein KKG81_09030 [bacterium]|jgi:hypothetical protein|nr:hypothetical protein [bacterium]